MARPRSEDKRHSILVAATRLFAAEGLSAPTSRIAKSAGVAEGTVFVYFASKDELLNQLYLELKGRLRASASVEAAKGDTREKLWQAWQTYVSWSLKHPEEHRVLAKLSMSPQITDETRAQVQKTFSDVLGLLDQAVAGGALKKQPVSFAGALMGAMADTTRDFMAADRVKAAEICKAGFAAFWNALTKG